MVGKRILKKKSQPQEATPPAPSEPVLAQRRANHRSTLKSGRTIGEQRERLETANEREQARQKLKRKNRARVALVTAGFLVLAAILAVIYFEFIYEDPSEPVAPPEEITYTPTIEIVDEDSSAAGGKITSRMQNYIGQAEVDYRALGYQPVKAVIPVGAVREVNFYLDGQPGYIKMYIDRPTAVSVEDADRMLRYLAGQGTTEFEYIDVRIPHKAYWK